MPCLAKKYECSRDEFKVDGNPDVDYSISTRELAHLIKQANIDSKKEDIVIIKSPVGLPGRVIRNKFVEDVVAGAQVPFRCAHHCLRTCDPKTIPYCIAKVLANASKGLLDDSFVFAGSNAYRCTEIVPVKTLMDQ